MGGREHVVWNSSADGFIVQNPPTAQNWLIGSVGPIQEDMRFGPQEPGIVDHHGANVDTNSLYLQQLADRMAVSNSQLREYVTGDYDLFVNDGPGSVDAHLFRTTCLTNSAASLPEQAIRWSDSTIRPIHRSFRSLGTTRWTPTNRFTTP